MSKNFYKGSISAMLLKLLSDNGKMYGYEITKKTKANTNGDFEITEGTLYTALHKLEAEEILEVEYDKVGGRIRKYYKLSEKGEKEAVSQIAELDNFIKNLTHFLSPKLS